MKKIILTLIAGTLLLTANNTKVLTNTDKRLNAKQDKRQAILNDGLTKKESKWAKKDAARETKLQAKTKSLHEKALRRELER